MREEERERLIAQRDCTDKPRAIVLLPDGIATSTGGAFEVESYEEVSLLHEDPTRSEDAQEELTGDSVAREVREGLERAITTIEEITGVSRDMSLPGRVPARTVMQLEDQRRVREWSYEEHDSARSNLPRSGEETGEGESGGDIARPREGASVQPIMLPVSERYPAVRQALVDALAEYDRGELVGIALIKEYQDSVGEAHSGGKMMLLAGCSRLAHRLNQIIDEG